MVEPQFRKTVSWPYRPWSLRRLSKVYRTLDLVYSNDMRGQNAE